MAFLIDIPPFSGFRQCLYFASQSRIYDGERSEVTYSGSLDAQVEKIVLIVDESVRADILGINAYEKDTTPYLRSLKTGIVNFGLAASSSNYSDYSNLILRTGLRKEEIPDHNQMTLKKPSIWPFTKKAGFYNVYLDAQSAEEWANYHNFMNEHEASFVDEIIRVRQKIAYESDGVAREKLMDHLKQPGKTFIMLNKYGIHFPYFRSYIPLSGLAMEGTPRSFMWNRIEELVSAIEGRPKIAQAGREIANFFFVKAIVWIH